MTAIIQFSNCFKSFEKLQVLSDISFDIEENSFILLKGASGVGKTTLLNLIAGILKPDKGNIKIKNQDLAKLNDTKLSEFRNKNIAYIRQTSGLVPWLNVIDNLKLPFSVSYLPTTTKKKNLQNFIELFNISEILKKYPDKISGGQYQRAAIASSLICETDIILADEPTNNLDKTNTKILLDLFANYKTKKTIIVISHIDIFDNLADKIWIIENGQLLKN